VTDIDPALVANADDVVRILYHVARRMQAARARQYAPEVVEVLRRIDSEKTAGEAPLLGVGSGNQLGELGKTSELKETKWGERPQVMEEALRTAFTDAIPGTTVTDVKVKRPLGVFHPHAHVSIRDPEGKNPVSDEGFSHGTIDASLRKKLFRKRWDMEGNALYLKPEYRKKGIGSAALGALQEAARDLGVEKITLQADEQGKAAWSRIPGIQFQPEERRLVHGDYQHWRKKHKGPDVPKGAPPAAYPKEFLKQWDGGFLFIGYELPLKKATAAMAKVAYQAPNTPMSAVAIPKPVHLQQADELLGTPPTQDDWNWYRKRLKRSEGFRQAVLLHPEADDKLKRHVRAIGSLQTGEHVRQTPSMTQPGKRYQLKLMKSGRVGCTCPDWYYKKSHGGGDCKHVRKFKQALDAGQKPRGYKTVMDKTSGLSDMEKEAVASWARAVVSTGGLEKTALRAGLKQVLKALRQAAKQKAMAKTLMSLPGADAQVGQMLMREADDMASNATRLHEQLVARGAVKPRGRVQPDVLSEQGQKVLPKGIEEGVQPLGRMTRTGPGAQFEHELQSTSKARGTPLGSGEAATKEVDRQGRIMKAWAKKRGYSDADLGYARDAQGQILRSAEGAAVPTNPAAHAGASRFTNRLQTKTLQRNTLREGSPQLSEFERTGVRRSSVPEFVPGVVDTLPTQSVRAATRGLALEELAATKMPTMATRQGNLLKRLQAQYGQWQKTRAATRKLKDLDNVYRQQGVPVAQGYEAKEALRFHRQHGYAKPRGAQAVTATASPAPSTGQFFKATQPGGKAPSGATATVPGNPPAGGSLSMKTQAMSGKLQSGPGGTQSQLNRRFKPTPTSEAPTMPGLQPLRG